MQCTRFHLQVPFGVFLPSPTAVGNEPGSRAEQQHYHQEGARRLDIGVRGRNGSDRGTTAGIHPSQPAQQDLAAGTSTTRRGSPTGN